jgi:hypothetical protein
MVRTDPASVVGPHTWPIPPPPHPTRDTRKPVRPKAAYSVVVYSYPYIVTYMNMLSHKCVRVLQTPRTYCRI